MNETELFTPREFAAYRRCSVRTLDRERAGGTGCPYIRISGRILYLRADVNRFIDAHRIGTSESSEGSRTPPPAGPSSDTYPIWRIKPSHRHSPPMTGISTILYPSQPPMM